MSGNHSEGPVVIGQPARPTDPHDIEMLISGQWQAWNEGRAIRAQDFSVESDYVTFDGTELHGFEENRRLHDQLGKGVLRGSRLSGRVSRIRFITADVAIVHSIGNLQLRFHPRPKPSRDSIQTTVFRRTPESWKIEAFQNTRIRRPRLFGRLLVRLANRL